MHTKKEILEFIKNFKTRSQYQKEIEDVFLNGDCYYFAIILKHRFPNIDIVYSPINNHFMCFNDFCIYDIRGDITNIISIYDLFLWENYQEFDELDYERIIKYCVHLKK